MDFFLLGPAATNSFVPSEVSAVPLPRKSQGLLRYTSESLHAAREAMFGCEILRSTWRNHWTGAFSPQEFSKQIPPWVRFFPVNNETKREDKEGGIIMDYLPSTSKVENF